MVWPSLGSRTAKEQNRTVQRTVEVAAAWMTEEVSLMSDARLNGVIAIPFSSSSVADAASSGDVIGGVASSACCRFTGRLDGRYR